MHYLTNYYKNLSEQLQEKVNYLEKLLNEGRVVRDPETGKTILLPNRRMMPPDYEPGKPGYEPRIPIKPEPKPIRPSHPGKKEFFIPQPGKPGQERRIHRGVLDPIRPKPIRPDKPGYEPRIPIKPEPKPIRPHFGLLPPTRPGEPRYKIAPPEDYRFHDSRYYRPRYNTLDHDDSKWLRLYQGKGLQGYVPKTDDELYN